MGQERLHRKERKNVSRAVAKKKRIKLLNYQPVIKKVDVEAIKKGFELKSQKTEK
ncbi:MAG: hypothetical protein IIA88_04415 [Bacteroidetes bacterium]|nr:hypothetical protein [Bacteroidota bacterium]